LHITITALEIQYISPLFAKGATALAQQIGEFI